MELPNLPLPVTACGAGGNRGGLGENGRVKRPRRPIQMRLLVSSFIIAAGVVLVVVGVLRGVTGAQRDNLPALVESVVPEPGAQTVPHQSRIFVDLEAGYTGVLIVDGLELQTLTQADLQRQAGDGKQVGVPLTTVYEEGNATLTFQPVRNAPIESLTTGQHVVEVDYWKITEGRQAARSFKWMFDVD